MEYSDRIKNRGFTIMELLVAMTVFLVVIGISSGIFTRTIRTQRIITDMSSSLNNITLALEQIAREARTGYAFSTADNYTSLSFTNARGEDVEYDIDSARVMRKKEGENPQPITSEGTNISDLKFTVRTNPTLVTIVLTALGEGDIEVHLQTSVSSRVIGL